MIVVQHFLKWVETAKVAERAAAASALARAYIQKDMSFDDRLATEAALTLLLDDASAKVRAALSETLSLSHRAPPQVIAALAADQPDVAAPIIARSPLMSDSDLVDRVAMGNSAIQCLVASRPQVSFAVAAAIAEVGSLAACIRLAGNPGARIAALSFRRMLERHGREAGLRAALMPDARLPADCRHMLLTQVGEALSAAPLVRALMGGERAEKIARDACIKASIALIDSIGQDELPALVEHLRLRGDLTPGFLVRVVAQGKIDFFAAALGVLSGQGDERITALLAGGRDGALAALFTKAGLKRNYHPPLLQALLVWREVANGKRIAGAQEVSWLMLKVLGATEGGAGPSEQDAPLAALLKKIHLDALRQNARQQALALAAA